MSDSSASRQRSKVILPAEPPALTPAAARVLPRILLDAYEKQRAAKDGLPLAEAQDLRRASWGVIAGGAPNDGRTRVNVGAADAPVFELRRRGQDAGGR
jgi:hypothetical protein